MRITMNGCNICNANSMTIVNGRIVGGSFSSAESKKIDERKSIRVDDINKIKVDSDLADVTVSVGSCDTVEVHYHGEVATDGNIEWSLTKSDDEINIVAKMDANIFNGSLKLDVVIPQKRFRLISVKCQNGTAEFHKNVKTSRLKVNSQNGSIESEADFEEITAQTRNGSVDISISAKSDIEISASSMNGNVNVELDNIGSCHISTSSMNGSARNRHNSTGKYKATGEISSMNGNVRIQ